MKVVIPAAGLGTRLLSSTKEQPKEMLPIFSSLDGGELSLKPILQLIVEQLFDSGFREFCFVVGRSKRAIEDHFTPDMQFVEQLTTKKKSQAATGLRRFYDHLAESKVVWVNQSEPRGFGDAVLTSEPVVDEERFLVHAGDTYIVSKRNHLTLGSKAHLANRAKATLFLTEVEDTTGYGVAVIGKQKGDAVLVEELEEKPNRPKSNLIIMPVYFFDPVIFGALRRTKPGVGGELQLTDAIRTLISDGHLVQAIVLGKDDLWLDIGTPETYWTALKGSYRYFGGRFP